MNRLTKIACLAVFATGLSAAAFAEGSRRHKAPTPEQRKEFLEKRIAKLPVEEQRLARVLAPLRDSLMHAMGDYHHRVKEGAQPRSLTAERNAIASLESQILRLQVENQEVWLDLVAHMPGPKDRRDRRHGDPDHDRPGSKDPREAPGPDEPNEMPPPPPPIP